MSIVPAPSPASSWRKRALSSLAALSSVAALSLLAAPLLLGACSSPVAPVAPPRGRPSPRPAPAPEPVSTIPEECGDSDSDACMPPSPWVSKLCSGVYPEVALHMFRKGTPWTRLFSKARAPAFNTAGGAPSLSDERVDMHEELIALRRNDDGRGMRAGEMQMGEIAGYDVLRWNGSCVTMHDGEFSTKPPRRGRVAHSRIEWRWLSDPIRSALQSDMDVHEAFVARRKECRGVTLGSVTKACVKQDNQLVDAIVAYVRAGGDLPEPSEHP
jgi:hypothetical protein